MDSLVAQTQEWLNKTYKGKTGYTKIAEDGVTGWGTMRALITALQIELGISSPNGNFGPATTAKFNAIGPIGANSSADKKNINYIIQGGLFCKGYDAGEFTGIITGKTETAVAQLQKDAGLSNCDGQVDAVLMKSLLSMDAFKLLNYGSYEGKEIIRKIQQYLNNKYIKNGYFATDIGLVPCDGIYGRSTNKALVYALQIEEGIEQPNGVFGPSTKRLCKTIPLQTTESRFVYLLQAALYCNGEDPNGFDGGFGNGCKKAVASFQSFSGLDSDGIAGLQTWASLLVSTGDPLRKGKACDTNTVITEERAQTLIKDGRSYVGRYLTGKNRLTPEEINTIYDNGLKLIPIMQVLGDERWYFSKTSGLSDARDALTMARLFGIGNGTVIYFAIDYDALISDLDEYIEPYFKAIKATFDNSYANPGKYRIGVYAPRAICTALAKKGYTCSSYVSDMSTGFSSNLGQRLPDNWSFDQIYEYPNGIGSGAGHLTLDNVVARNGHIECCNSINTISMTNYNKIKEAINSTPLLKAMGLELSGAGKLVFVDTENLKISVEVGTKFNIGDDSDSTVQIKNFKFDGAEFKSQIESVKSSLTADGEAQLSQSMKVCEEVEASVKVTSSINTLKIEVEADVNIAEDICPLPLTVTLCIELKNDDNMSISDQAEFAFTKFRMLSYNTVNGAIAIGKKVILILGAILIGVLAAFGVIAMISVIAAGSLAFDAAAVLIIVGCLGYKMLTEDSSNA